MIESEFRSFDIGETKIAAFEEQGLIHLFGQSVREAISKIQPRLVTPFAEVAISLASDFSLLRGDRFDCNS